MKRLFALILFLVFMGFIPFSCGCLFPDSCGCSGEDGMKNFEITNLELGRMGAYENILDDSAQFAYDSIYLFVSISDYKAVTVYEESLDVGFFTNMAVACSPVDPSAIQNISSIIITSDTKFALDSEVDIIEEGQDMTNRFLAASYFSGSLSPIEEFTNSEYTLSLYERIKIRLANRPYQPTDLRLDMTITMTDGDVYNFENQVLKVR